MKDAKAAKEANNDGIIDGIIWIRRKFNLSDAMTKAKILPEFLEALEPNKFHC